MPKGKVSKEKEVFLGKDGTPLSFTINLENWEKNRNPSIIIESSSGSKSVESTSSRNINYALGLEVLFGRLGDCNISIAKVVLETKTTKKLPESDRTVKLNYPVILANKSWEDLEKIRSSIGAGVKVTCQSPGAKKGSGCSEKRIRLFLNLEKAILPDASFIYGHTTMSLIEMKVPSIEINELLIEANEPPIEVNEDEIKRNLQSIKDRQGQPKFRKELLDIYAGRCIISGCNVEDAIDAAHIIPHQGVASNKLENGLLLRADIHNLFDVGLISIDPENFTVVISKTLHHSHYSHLCNKRISRPLFGKDIVSKKALEWHWKNVWKGDCLRH